jgi:uncharacterized protein YfaS (alpha-2-macroglobulin family)
MLDKARLSVLGAALALAAGVACVFAAAPPSQQSQREALMRASQAGNYKDAYDGLRKLALDPADDPKQVSGDLTTAVQCLRQLGRTDEIDEFREGVIAAHKGNWRLLETAAQTLAEGEHFGFIIAGKFHRGGHRGGGRMVNAMQRDRVRALQLMQQALPLTKDETDRSALGQFFLHFATLLLQGSGVHEPWRLQYLTDLGQLPDYEEGYNWYRGPGQGQGAPVDAEGNPVSHHLPKDYKSAKTDGERWRWMLLQAAEVDPARVNEADMQFANFLQGQFDVQTMAGFGVRPAADDVKDRRAGVFAVHTLGDDETIARLASGVKRFKVPDEFNWIKIYERVAARARSPWGEASRDTLAQIYENRRQYEKAAAAWKRAIEEYGRGPGNHRQQRLDQIVGNWGRFESGQDQPAGKPATVDFRYRNGDKVSFEAFAVDVPKLLDDVKSYLKASPNQLDWNQLNVQNIGYRLVEQGQRQYLGEKVAAWDLALKPRPGHVDDLVTVQTPLEKPGAYLLTGKMAGGNVSRVLVWVNDTVIVKKQLDGKVLYYVADAVTGTPVAGATLDFFGWKQVQAAPGRNLFRVETTALTARTDGDGQVVLGQDQISQDRQWLVTARKGKAGQGGADRFAHLGFTHVWFGRAYDAEYNQTKVFTITDRPVYRPGQTVHFKFWVRHAKYDQADTSSFANQTFKVQIHNPQGEKVYEQDLTADAFGGLEGTFSPSAGCTLGQYGLAVVNHGGGSFRVEEYKKPEFEVKVDAPKEPVSLGEKVTATVQAKYYFGAPVTKAKVKVKVLRSQHSSDWYPRGAWDWLYGRGYWWFAADYAWYPGWSEWGTRRPLPPWWGRGHVPPEVVLENETEIGPDGTFKVPIDTLPAKELHGDEDHQYSITAEVVDESRRTIVGTGNVLVARKPFRVFAWVDRGHYRTGDTVHASFAAHTLDQKPVEGKGELTLYQVRYGEKGQPNEKAVQTWELATDPEGRARQQLKAAEPGQYRLSYKLTDAKQHTIEGGYVFVVRGEGTDGRDFRFNDVELVTDKREYAPGERVKLLVNTNRADSTVLLFVRPTNGVCLPPKVLRLQGKSAQEEIAVVQRDMPNFFVEALTVAEGRVHTETREVVVPPEKRVLNVEVKPSQAEYLPGQKATVKLRLTDFFGKPFVGSTVLSVYDKSVEYVAGGSNVPEIREFFWKWRRHHFPQTETSLAHWFGNLLRQGEVPMSNLGVFGEGVIEMEGAPRGGPGFGYGVGGGARGAPGMAKSAAAAPAPAAPMGAMALRDGAANNFAARRELQSADRDGVFAGDDVGKDKKGGAGPGGPAGADVEPTVRKNFADTAFWAGSLTTDEKGEAQVELTMPENLTGWKVKAWAMGHGTKVGQGEAEVVTRKNLLVRLQAPRFFVQKDEVVLSANVHNYLKAEKAVKVSLELEGGTLAAQGELLRPVRIPAGGEQRVDWLVKVQAEGEAVVRMKAVSDEESDAMEMRFPCHVHGMLKTESFSGAIRPDKDSAQVTLSVPAERRINETRLEVRYSPTLAGAMVDALPYLVEYPYGCTEQTLNRFLPTVITQRVLQRMNLDLKEIEKKRTNLNAQEVGDAQERAKGWKRFPHNPVFNVAEVKQAADQGVQALTGMQLSDGGWGWFSGFGEHSWPHTTAVVVHGLQLAKENGVALAPGVLERGVEWLKNYQGEQLMRLRNAPSKTNPWKEHADNLDALVHMVLVDAGAASDDMREFLYRDRTHLAVYAKAMFGLTLHKQQQAEKLAMVLKNIEQFVVQDDENQTAYLRLPADSPWWYWYGSEVEANAYYLKLLARTSPKDEKASRLVKYLLNNRKHSTYWNSTRDTAVCVEAMAEYLAASGEDRPDMTVEVWLDGRKHKEVKIDASNLFSFDNAFVLVGDAVDTGKHTLELRRRGTGPVYFNAYLTNFTLEDFITKAGLEVKVNRKYYKLTRADKTEKVAGARGQAADQRVEKYERSELANLAQLKSGDLVEVELEIDSKNDYEYLVFEDPKAAGFEPLLVRSGYHPNDLGAYMELRDDRVCFFVRQLARGKHSVSYRLRAEIPGRFSALPTRAYAMYAPELQGNSDEIKLVIKD